MRSSQSLLIAASSALLLAACSSSGGSGGGSGNNLGAITQEAKGTQFSQALVDDIKMLRQKSDAVMPDTSILTETDATKKSKSIAKLNAEGQQWLQKMQANCQASTTGQAPTESKGSGTTTVSITGAQCPISAVTTTTQSNNMGENGGSMDISATIDEKVLDPALVTSSSSREMKGQFSVHSDFARSGDSQTMHMTETGGFDMDLVSTQVHLDIKMEMVGGNGSQQAAVAFHASSEKGRVDAGVVMDNQTPHYYIGGNEVSAETFQQTFGDLGSISSSAASH